MYWEQARTRRPKPSQMALDFLSAPGVLPSMQFLVPGSKLLFILVSSVDTERSFSGGCLQVNHLQHNMGSNTFRAQMAIGSWDRTPLLPDITEIVKMIGKGKETDRRAN